MIQITIIYLLFTASIAFWFWWAIKEARSKTGCPVNVALFFANGFIQLVMVAPSLADIVLKLGWFRHCCGF